MDILRRFFPLPEQSFFLFGPRGTGKSTWLRHVFPDALLIDLLRPDVHRSLDACPERLVEIVAGSPQADVVVLDEVQRVPELLSVVHSLIEERRGLRYGPSATRKPRPCWSTAAWSVYASTASGASRARPFSVPCVRITR